MEWNKEAVSPPRIQTACTQGRHLEFPLSQDSLQGLPLYWAATVKQSLFLKSVGPQPRKQKPFSYFFNWK